MAVLGPPRTVGNGLGEVGTLTRWDARGSLFRTFVSVCVLVPVERPPVPGSSGDGSGKDSRPKAFDDKEKT